MTSDTRRAHGWIAAMISAAVLLCMAPAVVVAQGGGEPSEAVTPVDDAPSDAGDETGSAEDGDGAGGTDAADVAGGTDAAGGADAADGAAAAGADAAAETEAGDTAQAGVPASFEDLVALDVPDGWRMRLVYADTEARTYLIDSPIEGLPALELHVLNLETRDVDLTDGKAVNRLASQLVYRYLAIEKQVDFQARGRIQLKLDGCDALSHTYRDGEREVRVIGCAHPSARRLYVFRFDLPEALKDTRESVIKTLNALLLERVSMVAAAAPAPTGAPADAGTPDAAGTADAGSADTGEAEGADATTP